MAHGAFALRRLPAPPVRGLCRGPRRGHAHYVLALVLALLPALAAAQGQDSAPAYRSAEEAYVAALSTLPSRGPSPDAPVWRAAIDAASRAVRSADEEVRAARGASGPTSTATLEAEAGLRHALALAARMYGSLGWHSRAFENWERFLNEGGELLDESHPPAGLPAEQAAEFPTDLTFATRALGQLAFARYGAGDLEGARAYYLTILDLQPSNPEALRWLARMAFEEGDTASAIQIWSRLVEVAPGDEGARFFLELSRERDEFGVEASEAYRAGIRAYEAGEMDEAFELFVRAHRVNPSFADAAVWAARSALEAGRPAQAEPYWRSALEADPDDQRSAWFLEFTRAQLAWGVGPATDYYAGQTAYGEGDLERAKELFLGAARANPDYQDAWVWAARSTQELGQAAEASEYWQEVLRLAPGDERARHFLNLTRQQVAFGPEAGDAFARGVAAYQAGDVERARAGLSAAVEVAPDFTDAWSQLARLEFQVGNYAAAAEAYGRALALEPGNDEFEFFANEARRLAGVAAGPEGEPEAEPVTGSQEEAETPDGSEPAEEQETQDGPETAEEPGASDAQEDDEGVEDVQEDDDEDEGSEIVPLPPSAPGGQ